VLLVGVFIRLVGAPTRPYRFSSGSFFLKIAIGKRPGGASLRGPAPSDQSAPSVIFASDCRWQRGLGAHNKRAATQIVAALLLYCRNNSEVVPAVSLVTVIPAIWQRSEECFCFGELGMTIDVGYVEAVEVAGNGPARFVATSVRIPSGRSVATEVPRWRPLPIGSRSAVTWPVQRILICCHTGAALSSVSDKGAARTAGKVSQRLSKVPVGIVDVDAIAGGQARGRADMDL
jgi:hypothetical protein